MTVYMYTGIWLLEKRAYFDNLTFCGPFRQPG